MSSDGRPSDGVRGAWIALALLLCALFSAACAGGAAPRTVTAPRPPAVDATIGPGDVFDVRVFQEADLSGAYRVGPDGTIDFPLIGKLEVAGRTQGQVAELLRDRLTAFLQAPQVTVLLKEINSKHVIVYGQVQRPGTFPYQGPMTLSQLISVAGGFTQMAARQKVRIQRTVAERQQVVEVDMTAIYEGRAPNQFIEAGDEIFVPERLF